MNPGPTADRVYHTLKARILGREFRPGERLDPTLLADALASSATPVRDALHVMVGEGLVEARPNEGFHVPLLDEIGLKDLYDWSAELLLLAIKSWPREIAGAAPDAQEGGSIVDRTAILFIAIARRSSNGEHIAAVAAASARLHSVRTVEPHVLSETQAELDALELAFQTDDRDRLRSLLAAYHRRRRRSTAEIVRATYRHE